MSFIPPSIDFFTIPDVVSTTLSKRTEEILPTNFTNGYDSDLLFNIDAQDTEFSSMQFELGFTMQLLDRKTNQSLDDTFPIAPINMAGMTQFRTVNFHVENDYWHVKCTEKR